MKWDAAEFLGKFPDGVDALRAGRRKFAPTAKEEADPRAENVVVEGDFRPRVRLPGAGRLGSDFARDLGAVLATHDIFRRAGRACCVGMDGKLVMLDATLFRGLVERWVVCEGVAGRGENRHYEPQTMSEESAAFVLRSWEFLEQLREIRRVVPVPLPVWRGEGKIELLGKGYDAESHVLVESKAEEVEEMDPGEAILFLEALLGEMPFEPTKREQMFSNQLAVMLGVFCDLLVEQGLPRPAFVFLANSEGSGKTLLIRLAVCPVYGALDVKAPPSAVGGSDELRKVLTTEVLAGSPYICLDNFKSGSMIENPALEAFITATAWSDRYLGSMDRVSAPRDTLVFLSGNNCRVGPDIRRRSLFVELFCEDVRSETRNIANYLNEKKIIAAAPKIRAALWSLVRYWTEKGCPQSKTQHGSYREWGHVVGGILEALDMTSPLLDVALTRGGDTDLADMEILLSTIWKEGPDEVGEVQKEHEGALSLRPKDLLAKARMLGLFTRFLSEDEPAGSGAAKERGMFGKVCYRFEGKRLECGIKFTKSEHSARSNRRYVLDMA